MTTYARRRAALTLGALIVGVTAALPTGPASAATTAVIATFSPTSGVLSVFGDSVDNVVVVSRNAAGTIFVNGGAVPVTGGTPTVGNVSLISMFGQAGNDGLRIDESFGGMPPANLFGGSGDDRLVGGPGADLIFGQAGIDQLEGRGSNDQLFGGTEDDLLFGGDGDDQVFGEAGNDRLRWIDEDDDDLLEGGTELDTVEVTLGTGADTVVLGANGSRTGVFADGVALDVVAEILSIDGSSGNDTMVADDISPTTHLRLLGNLGNDRLFGGSSAEELLGGFDDDVVNGGGGADQVLGGPGNDVLEGGDGADQVVGDTGNDQLIWSEGGGDDRLDGGADLDVTKVTTGATPDTVLVTAAAGGRVQVRSPGVFALDVSTERVEVVGGAANDVLSVGLGLAAVVQVKLVGGLGDDRLEGGDGGDEMLGGEGNDLLFGRRGNDVISGELGNDQALGDEGNDLIAGNDGDDVLFGGAGNDNLDGAAGFDFLRGGSGFDVGFGGEDVQGVP